MTISTVDRLNKLERNARWYRRATLLMGCLFLVSFAWKGAAQSEVLSTRRLEIVDAAGQPTLVLHSNPTGGGMVELLREPGGDRVLVLSGERTGGLVLIGTGGAKGERRYTELSPTHLRARGTDDQAIWELGAGADGAKLLLADESGAAAAELVVLPEATARLRTAAEPGELAEFRYEPPTELRLRKLEIENEVGQRIATLGGDAEGGVLSLAAKDGTVSTRLSQDASGHGRLELLVRSGVRTLDLSLTPQGEGAVGIYSSEGQPLVRINPAYKGRLHLGGEVGVYNRTSETPVCTLRVDEAGRGEVGAWDREGEGRVLAPH